MHWRWESFIILPKHVFEQKDLRVILDAELKFDEHISVEVKKENVIPVLISRTFSYFDSPLQKIIYYTASWIWTSNMDTTFGKMYNYSGKCATTSHKIGGWFWSNELLRKTKKVEPTIVGLQEILRHFDRDFQTFPYYDNSTLPENFRPRNRPSGKHDYQLVQKLPKMALENSRQFFSTFKRSKPETSSQKKSYLPSLSTHLKTNWMKRGRIYQ